MATQVSLLATGCEKAPATPKLNYIPPNGEPYKVKGADDWWKLAARPQVVAAGLNAMDLCFYNFQTRDGREINWYLRNKVGCTKTTVDRKNYAFSDDARPGTVYLPKAGAGGGGGGGRGPGGLPIVGVIPGGNGPGGVAVPQEFTIEKESQLKTIGYVNVKWKVVGKVVVEWGNATPDFKVKAASNATKREFGLAGEKLISDDLSLQLSAKMKADSLADPKAWRNILKEGVEATVKKKFKTPILGAIEFGPRAPKDGLFFVFKVTTQDAKLPIADLGWLFDVPPGNRTSTAKVSLQVSFSFGPSPKAIEALRPILAAAEGPAAGAGVLLGMAAWIAFCGHAISSTYQRADDMAFYSWYVTGFVDEVLPVGGGGYQFPPKPADREKAEGMVRLGRQDAQATAAREFSGMDMDALTAYRISILAMFGIDDADSLSDPRRSAARRFLRGLVSKKLLAEKGIKTV